MSLIMLNGLSNLGSEVSKRPFLAGVVLFVCGLAYYLVTDFLQTYIRRPSHFVHKSALSGALSGLFGRKKFDAPLVERRPGETYREVLARGSALYPDRPYKIQHFPNEFVVLPPQCLEDVRNNPESSLSFQQASYDFFLGDFTGITGHEKATTTTIRRDIGRLLDSVYEIVQDKAVSALLEEIGPCDQPTEILLYPKIVSTIIKISQRVFVGEELASNPEWLEIIRISTGGAFVAVPILWKFNWLLRPLIAWQKMPHLRLIRSYKQRAAELLKPILEKRLEDMKDPSFKAPPDLLQLIIEGAPDGKGRDLGYQVDAQINTGRAALFTTAGTIYHLLYDLCVRPEYVEPLRQEALGVGDAMMTRQNVAKLVKLDSFIREAQRFTISMLVGTMRKVTKPLKIATGDVLPVGTIVGVDTHAIHFERSPLQDPEKFDGFRYLDLRSKPGNQAKFQAVTTGPNQLTFGYGTQACPGRFFAIHEAKVVIAHILRNYEWKLVDPPKGMSVVNGLDGILSKVDPTVKFVFQKRQKQE